MERRHKPTDERLEELKDFVLKHPKNVWSAEEISTALSISLNHARDLMKVFAKKYGFHYRQSMLYTEGYAYINLLPEDIRKRIYGICRRTSISINSVVHELLRLYNEGFSLDDACTRLEVVLGVRR